MIGLRRWECICKAPECRNPEYGRDHSALQYSMISLSWKAIQEQQEIINNLQKRVETLEAQIKESDINE